MLINAEVGTGIRNENDFSVLIFSVWGCFKYKVNFVFLSFEKWGLKCILNCEIWSLGTKSHLSVFVYDSNLEILADMFIQGGVLLKKVSWLILERQVIFLAGGRVVILACDFISVAHLVGTVRFSR